jgi:IMP dehydrogenase/GMP reductase
MGGLIITRVDTPQASADWSGVEARMSAEQVMCMASGSVGGVHKYYFFAQEVTTALFPSFPSSLSTRRSGAELDTMAQDRSSAHFVVEVVGETAKGRLTARFKTETERALPHFTRHFKLALSRALGLN